MLMAAMALAAASLVTEAVVMAKVPFVREAIFRRSWLSVPFSLALTSIWAHLFGAAGTTVLIAAMGGVAVSSISYWILGKFFGPKKVKATVN